MKYSKAVNQVLVLATMFGDMFPFMRKSNGTKYKREVNDEIAQIAMRQKGEREAKYRAMLIRTGRVKDYGHCIAINQRNADRKFARVANATL